MTKRATGIVLIAVAATLWGTWPLYTRAGGPAGVSIGFLALVVMALPAPFVFKRAAFADRGAVWALLLVGLADAGNMVLYFSALERGPIVVAVLSHYLAPTLVALAAPALLGERGSTRALWASPVVLAGLALVLNQGSSTAGWEVTALLGGGSAIFYAGVVLGSRRAAKSFTPIAVMSLHAAVSALILFVVLGRQVIPTSVDRGLAIVLFGCAVNGLFAALLFNLSLQRLEAQLVGLFTYLEPLTAAVLGVVVLGDPVGLASVAGLLLVVVAGGWAASAPPPRIEAPALRQP
ncbi:MAG: DMT family transporter [Archangium sp.]|nr:DMT family transporter [Archangium sp.]